MKEEVVSDELLREFLLAEVDDEERQRIESLYITGAISRDAVIEAEEHLIDDYLSNNLTSAEKQKFLSQYADTPLQRRRLRITESVKDWAENHDASVVITAPNTSPGFRELLLRLRLKPRFLIPSVAILVVIFFAGIWFLSRSGQNNSVLAIQQQIQQLNASSGATELVPESVSLVLPPVSVRSVEQKPEFTPQPEIRVLALRLLWIQKQQYSTYEAVINRVGDKESFTVRTLHPGEANAIILKVPANILVRGSYTIELRGVAADGTKGLSEEYSFAVN